MMTGPTYKDAKAVAPITYDPARSVVLGGDIAAVHRAYDQFNAIAVDWDLMDEAEPVHARAQFTIQQPVSAQGPGTFLGEAQRRITLKPSETEGWWFNRADRPDDLPVGVSIHNVWTTGGVISNIVLRSGAPGNYIRMVEHIIALRLGMPIDNVVIEMDSGDPPLFERGALDLVEAMESAGQIALDRPVDFVTVKEPVTMGGSNGGFLTLYPAHPTRPYLTTDCAVDFPTAIGKQRIRFPLNAKNFRHGAAARTNTSASKKLYCQTIGRCFADIRNLGYTEKNVLIAGRRRYINEPALLHEGKSLEAVWHRATLDLFAALALIEKGRFLGHVVSYKAGHTLDVNMIRLLYQFDLLTPVTVSNSANYTTC